MRNIVKAIPCALLLLAGCQDAYVSDPSRGMVQNQFVGTWDGTTGDGDTYTISFTADQRWESYKVEAGAQKPQYRGTYVPQGKRVEITIKEEADPKTLRWRPERRNVPANVVGILTTGRLRVGPVLTDLELAKR